MGRRRRGWEVAEHRGTSERTGHLTHVQGTVDAGASETHTVIKVSTRFFFVFQLLPPHRTRPVSRSYGSAGVSARTLASFPEALCDRWGSGRARSFLTDRPILPPCSQTPPIGNVGLGSGTGVNANPFPLSKHSGGWPLLRQRFCWMLHARTRDSSSLVQEPTSLIPPADFPYAEVCADCLFFGRGHSRACFSTGAPPVFVW